ncbi:MAG: hypothetical protein U0800_22730 [Isosphaeraceae bacterium]
MSDWLSAKTLLAIASDTGEEFPACVLFYVEDDNDLVDEHGLIVDGAGTTYPNQPIDTYDQATADVHGPWVVCFSSPSAIESLRREDYVSRLLFDESVIKEFPVRQLIRRSLVEKARLIVDPFLAGGQKFSHQELEQLRHAMPGIAFYEPAVVKTPPKNPPGS